MKERSNQTAVRSRLRILAPMAGGLLFLVLLALCIAGRLRLDGVGMLGFITDGLKLPPVQRMVRSFVLGLLLPTYLIGGLVIWFWTYLCLGFGHPEWRKVWGFREAFLLTLAGFLFGHWLLWLQVPTALWVIPGLRSIPFFILLPLIGLVALAAPILWLWRQGRGWIGGTLALGGLLLGWGAVALFPLVMPRIPSKAQGGDRPCKVLVLGVDGLRSDTFVKLTEELNGQRYRHAYTPVPATRMLWNILWGGDPIHFTMGHVPIAAEEFTNPNGLVLVREAERQGWKPRFYIDDGGTIGLSGREVGFDDVLMPAHGLENFINSNLSVSFPLYAAWENWTKPFPTTNPWAPLDLGLREALRLGRGSQWVMFHSCLCHQPIHLTYAELKQLGRWWTLPPNHLKPLADVRQLTPAYVARYDERMSPFRAYEIRMGSILNAWKPIWNELSKDPDYGNATRVIFSDHGERFRHVADRIQFQGTHGFNLDPWECRVALMVAGPGWPDRAPVSDTTMSLLSIRDEVTHLLEGRPGFQKEAMEKAYPEAPMRYHTLSLDGLGGNSSDIYRTMSPLEIIQKSGVTDAGQWVLWYGKTREERSKDVSVAFGRGNFLEVIRPLKAEGAHRLAYTGYSLDRFETMSQEELTRARARIEELLIQGVTRK